MQVLYVDILLFIIFGFSKIRRIFFQWQIMAFNIFNNISIESNNKYLELLRLKSNMKK